MSTGFSTTQHQRAVAFRRLHELPEPFVVANAWDAGTARLLTRTGYAALATTSAGLAFSLGRPDGRNLVSLEETLDNVRAVAAATHLPVSADLEHGFARDADGVADTIRLAARAGAVGASIEDTTGDPADQVRPLAEAVQRVRAAVAAARALPFPFTVTARADNFLYGRADLDDTIARLRAYEEAGADVLYAPGLPDLNAVRAVCAAVGRPVNVLAGVGGLAGASVADLAACGVRRISVGSGLARAALGAAWAAARDILDGGGFRTVAQAPTYADLNRMWDGSPAAASPAPRERV